MEIRCLSKVSLLFKTLSNPVSRVSWIKKFSVLNMDELWNILKLKLQNLSKILERSVERITGPNALKAKKTQKGHKE